MEEGIIPQAPVAPIAPVVPVTPDPVAPVIPAPVAPQAPDYSEIEKKIETSVSEKVSKSVIEKIGDALGLTKKEAEQVLPTDPKELKAYIEKTAEDKAKSLMQAKEDEVVKTQKERDDQLAEGAKTFQTTWGRDYAEMAGLKMVPPITNAADKNDPGNLAKTKILLKLSEVIKENEAKGIDYVPTLWEIVSRYPNVLKIETTAGGTVPISGGGKNMVSGMDADYSRIHSTSIEDMVKDKMGA